MKAATVRYFVPNGYDAFWKFTANSGGLVPVHCVPKTMQCCVSPL